jgi:IS5 family transposase
VQERRLDRPGPWLRPGFPVTDAAADDGVHRPTVIDKTNTASKVWADAPCRSAANEAHLARHGLRSRIALRRQPGFELTP